MNIAPIDDNTVAIQLTEQDRAYLMMLGLQYCFDKGINAFGNRTIQQLAQEILAANANDEQAS